MPREEKSVSGAEGKTLWRCRFTLGLVREEGVDLAGRTVVGNDGEALVVHVEDQVLTL